MTEFYPENPRKSRNFRKFPKFPKIVKNSRKFPENHRKFTIFSLFFISCTSRYSREISKCPKNPPNFSRKTEKCNFGKFREISGFWPSKKNIIFIKFQHRTGVWAPRKIRGNFGTFLVKILSKIDDFWKKLHFFLIKPRCSSLTHQLT